ncbi:MAG: hypothetical protein K8J08_08210 [Thermoanaerobaculia bacterium]|nr:hypothetical protein [Thermoanaerobaculia bacterium]
MRGVPISVATPVRPAPLLGLDLAFGPLHLEVSAPESWLALFLERYEKCRIEPGSLDGGSPDFRIEIEINSADLPSHIPSALAVVRERVQFRNHVDGATLCGTSFDAEIDWPTRRASVRSPTALYAIDHLLEIILPILWSPHGLLLHAAALVDADRQGAWLASGPSGIGKSTLARLCGSRAIADELVAVDLRTDPPTVHSMPYSASRPQCAEVVGIHLLDQAPRHATRRLDQAETLRRLSREVLWPEQDARATEAVVDHLTQLVRRTPAWQLSFAPQADVWRFVSQPESAS